MTTKLMCWLPESTYLDEDSKNLLIDEGITPILDSSYSTEIWAAQGKPEWALRYINFGAESGLQPYFDEPLTENIWDISRIRALSAIEDIPTDQMIHTTIGETCTEYIQQLVNAGCKSITFTCYGWHLFRIFGLNIRMPLSTQLNTWKKLEKLYNKQVQKWFIVDKDFGYNAMVSDGKFSFCWIMLDQVKHFKKLVSWCIQNNKTIGLVAPDNQKNNPEWVKEHLELFIKSYKEITNGIG